MATGMEETIHVWAGQIPTDASTAAVKDAVRMKGQSDEPQVQFDVRSLHWESWTCLEVI